VVLSVAYSVRLSGERVCLFVSYSLVGRFFYTTFFYCCRDGFRSFLSRGPGLADDCSEDSLCTGFFRLDNFGHCWLFSDNARASCGRVGQFSYIYFYMIQFVGGPRSHLSAIVSGPRANGSLFLCFWCCVGMVLAAVRLISSPLFRVSFISCLLVCR